MIEVINLNFGYDENLVLEDINFNYKSSDFLCVIGPNGGGKSTFLKLLLGLLNPKNGTILLDGKTPKEFCKNVGYVPQHIPINSTFPLSVLEVVLMGRIDQKRFGFYSKFDKEKALKALKIVGMGDFSKRRISLLSGGQRQRVYIARAICSDAKILFLDEPTASIDARGQVEIYEILKNINQSGKGILMISHDLNIAINYASKVAYINKNLVMHEIDQGKKDNFLAHLENSHGHFCDVELILKECSCKKF
ncbi:ABC transporter ATP-binding protein [Campylobacter sp. FMV-PI01]|uniref:ABC transporter ATP-binding protein n=1 Tax=Campylobacter portucalensis TaxID=2608384 RepID=A0A6L5WKJ1_9BACT|nr:ABC transporter ATP-binding protein [Campylobacter portucalensis]MSN96261.1 ABC transporter ATP-binding protein [Campylobacter portucalensis]